MKIGKRLIALLLVMVLTISGLSLTAFAGTGGKSSADAIAWVKSQVGTPLDYDGVYGAQCVDLIAYYYLYLGNTTSGGNAEAYRYNALPSGWQRIQGATPQKGDILVYGPSDSNPYGHVAIYESDYSTYHQNFNSHSYVEQVTYRYNGLSNPYWGVIRPDFSTGATTMAWTEVAANPSQTDARISVKIVPSVSGNFGEIGVTVYNALGNVVGTKKEAADSSAHTYLNIWYDITSELGVTLAAGHTYKYQYYAYFNGVKYTSDVYSFTTTGTAAHTYGSWSVKVAATCTEEGTQVRSCSICGFEEYQSIAKLENVFADISGNEYYATPVVWAANEGITTGITATIFAPKVDCTRAQIVTFLWRSQGMPEPQTTVNPFSDVKSTNYYYKAVLWAVDQGITNGTSATTFSPNDNCTRAQAVTFLWRVAGKPTPSSTASRFTDLRAGAYYTNAVAWAVENGITTGTTSTTTFSPEDTCIRGQIVTFLWRYMN